LLKILLYSAGRFANIYHLIISSYLLIDREAETSIKYFALQLFTVPSVSLYVVLNHHLITRLLNIITSFFTNQITIVNVVGNRNALGYGTVKQIVYPPVKDIPLDVDSFPFKSKRFMPVFSDLRYLCATETVQKLIALDCAGEHFPNNVRGDGREDTYLMGFAKTCQLFMGINPNKRFTNTHVEYETDAWISVFNVTLSLSRVIKVFGAAFGEKLKTEEDEAGMSTSDEESDQEERRKRTKGLVKAIEDVVGCILNEVGIKSHEQAQYEAVMAFERTAGSDAGAGDGDTDTIGANTQKPRKFTAPEFHEVDFGFEGEELEGKAKKWDIVAFEVLEGWVSFHHSLHWLLAELFKHVGLLGSDNLANHFREQQLEVRNVREMLKRYCGGNEKEVLILIDYPLRGWLDCLIRFERRILTFSTSSLGYDCADKDWSLGSQWLCHPWSTLALQGLHATRIML
jgi:E3 ubiquitin-protein ligase UBR1